MQSMEPTVLALGVAWYVIFLLSTVLHEGAHTAASQVTLDPLPHLQREPVGMIAVPLISYVVNGWMLGWASAPYDPHWADRYPHRSALMALAGPGANLLLAVTAGGVMRLGIMQGWLVIPATGSFTAVVQCAPGGAPALAQMLSIAFSLNLLLGAFNLMPLPPLDGCSVIGLFMAESRARRWQAWTRQGVWAMPALLVAWAMFGRLAGPLWVAGVRMVWGG